MTNVVTISGMFGDGKTYFADSPVVIDISGLEWPTDTEGKPTSPFNIVRVEVMPTGDSEAEAQLSAMFPDSNAAFKTDEKGYINGAEIFVMTDYYGETHNALVVTSYSKGERYPILEDEIYKNNCSRTTWELFMRADVTVFKRIVELDSNNGHRDTLLQLCSKAYSQWSSAGDFRADTGGQSSISFDISSALRAMWAGYNFAEISVAEAAMNTRSTRQAARYMRKYALRIYTEYIATDPEGEKVFTTTQYTDEYGNTLIPGGQCLIGGMTEFERYTVGEKSNADVSHLEHTGVRNGDASTKPSGSPELVGKSSMTSWVDVQEGFTKSIFYPAPTALQLPAITGSPDDVAGRETGWTGHEPIVLRDDIDYVDFLFVNRRGAVETCSAQMLEAMNISVSTKQYNRVERPAFKIAQSLMAISSGGRRSWPMSSGYQTREWAEWWTLEFLMSRQKWMRYKVPGQASEIYIPVTVKPDKESILIYDKTKQNMPHVDFTVTLALEG